MIGREERIAKIRERTVDPADVVMEARGLSTTVGHRDIAFSLRRGEILGLYGLVGAGRSELAKAMLGGGGHRRRADRPRQAGAHPRHARGAARLPHRLCQRGPEGRGADPHPLGPRERRDHHLAAHRGIPRPDPAGCARRRAVQPFVDRLEVRTPSLSQAVGNLSGGNQQKVSIAKWLAANADILIIDEPTVGIDIKTKTYLHELIGEIAAGGVSVILISSDMPEMITVADRILVMHGFRIVGEVENDHRYETTSKAIMSRIHAVEETEPEAAA